MDTDGTVIYRFMTGTWHTITIPADKKNDPAYDPEELYAGYFAFPAQLPEGVEVEEDEVDHIWDDELKINKPAVDPEDIRKREEQILAVRRIDEDDENNPIIHAEQGPNRYHSITWFFPDPEGDGCRVTYDCDLGTKEVVYFDAAGTEIELTEGVMYEWALALYDAD